MKKTLAIAAAFLLTAALSAENIFKGNTFSVEDDEVFYKFTDDKNAKIVSNDTNEGETTHMELEYIIDEKNKTIRLCPKKIDTALFGIPGIEDRLVTKKELLDTIKAEGFKEDVFNKQFEELTGFNPHIELGKKESADRIVNALLYSEFFSDSEYDENVDYKAKLRETDYGEEESALGEEAENEIALLTKLTTDTISNMDTEMELLEATVASTFDFSMTFNYEQEEDGSVKFSESPQSVDAQSVFLRMEADGTARNAYITNGILSIAREVEDDRTPEIDRYATKDSLKKPAGRITFVKAGNPREKIKAAYKLDNSQDPVVMEVTFKSGALKGFTIKGLYHTSKSTLIPIK
jgi:hypothetical protein